MGSGNPRWQWLGLRWLAPVSVALIGVAASLFAWWVAERADDHRVRSVLELRAEWRARDIEAKVRLSGNAVENIAIAMAATTAEASAALDQERFARIAARARVDTVHVRALSWAQRVPREGVPAFEREARATGVPDYRVFDVTPDLQRTTLRDRAEYFPVLYEARLEGDLPLQGLAIGQYDGRRIPMERARDDGLPVATLPVSPVGAATPELVYLLFWPVYDGIAVPADVAARRARLRGYAFGSYRIVALLDAAIRDTPEIVETIRFAIAAAAPARGAAAAVPETAAAVYSPTTRVIQPAAAAPAPAEPPAVRIARGFTVFGQRWALTFDYAPAAVAALRASDAWGWLVAGLLLTASLVFYLVRERGRTAAIAALVEERTAELRRTSAQLHQAQKMEEIGNLTGGMAHDFNNLLSIVIGNADLLKDRVKDDATAGQLADGVLQAGLRGAELTRQLLAFARRQPLAPRPTDVNELAGGMIRLLRRTLGENIEIKLVTAPDVWPVMIDPAQLSSAIANLATNARDAMPDGGMLTVETRNASLDSDYAKANPDVVPGDFALLEVSDTGSGMTPATAARAFEPFFSTKEAGRGTGLGLSMVFGFVKQSKGHVKIYSEVGVGTTVRLYLPRATTSEEAAAQADAAPAAPAALPKGHGIILAVDDDAEVRRAVTRQLADLGYTVIEAENAPAALALLADAARPIDLLFTDVIMPGGMNGHELARAALALRPSLRVLFTSGYPGTALRNGETLGHGAHILSKPYRKQDLARKLRELLEA